ncbi:MAG: arginine--tRNA ligase, partial [Amphritea sp.]|nr:arginine--tRNA ligase [Amphritea sp.]
YYIQYAHARVCSIFRKLAEHSLQWDEETGLGALSRLELESEKRLTIKLGRYPEVVKRAADIREPHLVATYLYELASDFHTYYNSEKTLVDDTELRNARLTLTAAVRHVLANGLDLMGVSAPDLM